VLADLAPLTHKLQEATTFRTPELPPPNTLPEPSVPNVPNVPSDNKQIRKRWQYFFAQHFKLLAQDNACRIEKEMSKQRQA
jgi:hypothetical protein